MTRSRHIQRPRVPWVPSEDEIIRRLFPNNVTAEVGALIDRSPGAVFKRAAQLGVKKSAAYLASDRAGRIQRGKQSPAMKATQFQKGLVPQNKGLRRPGWAPGRMAETQFKPGKLSGAAAMKLVPIGTEVLDDAGYRKRKIRDDAPPNMSRLNWKFVHVIAWEEAHGPIPTGHCLAFRNGDKTDIRTENLELITRAERMRRNTIQRYPPELKEVIRLTAKVRRTIRKKTHEE